jgi:hypothetical protein
VEVYLHSFLTCAIDDGDCKALQPDPFISTETAPIIHWLEVGRGVLEKSFSLPGWMLDRPLHLLVKSFFKIRHNISILINTCQQTQNCKGVSFQNKFPVLYPTNLVKYLLKRKTG